MHCRMLNAGPMTIPRMNYEDTRAVLYRKLVQQKKGPLTEHEIKKIVGKWQSEQQDNDIPAEVVER